MIPVVAQADICSVSHKVGSYLDWWVIINKNIEEAKCKKNDVFRASIYESYKNKKEGNLILFHLITNYCNLDKSIVHDDSDDTNIYLVCKFIRND